MTKQKQVLFQKIKNSIKSNPFQYVNAHSDGWNFASNGKLAVATKGDDTRLPSDMHTASLANKLISLVRRETTRVRTPATREIRVGKHLLTQDLKDYKRWFKESLCSLYQKELGPQLVWLVDSGDHLSVQRYEHISPSNLNLKRVIELTPPPVPDNAIALVNLSYLQYVLEGLPASSRLEYESDTRTNTLVFTSPSFEAVLAPVSIRE